MKICTFKNKQKSENMNKNHPKKDMEHFMIYKKFMDLEKVYGFENIHAFQKG